MRLLVNVLFRLPWPWLVAALYLYLTWKLLRACPRDTSSGEEWERGTLFGAAVWSLRRREWLVPFVVWLAAGVIAFFPWYAWVSEQYREPTEAEKEEVRRLEREIRRERQQPDRATEKAPGAGD